MGNKQFNRMEKEIQYCQNESRKRGSAESDIQDEDANKLPISPETAQELCHAQAPLSVIVATNVPESKFKFDITRPCEVRITGIAVLELDRIVLCNNKGKLIYVYSSSGQFLQELTVLSNPFDIAVLSEKKNAVVSFQGEKYIQIVISSPTYVSPDDELEIKSPCTGGISSYGEDIAVGTKRGIEIYNRHGQFVKSIETLVENMFYLKYANGNVTYSNGINRIRKKYKGKTKFNIKSREDKKFRPLDIALVPNGDGYIAEYTTDVILKFTSGMKNAEIELQHDDGIYGPRGLCFNSNYSKLFIVNNGGQSVYIHNLNSKWL